MILCEKEKKNVPTNLKCCVCWFSFLGLMRQSRIAGERSHVEWFCQFHHVILGSFVSSLMVTLVFQNTQDENSLPTWENQDSLGTTFQMLRKEDFSVGTFVLSPFFLGLLAQGAILPTGNWVPRVSVLSKRSDILEWPYLCLKEGINRMVPDYSFFFPF